MGMTISDGSLNVSKLPIEENAIYDSGVADEVHHILLQCNFFEKLRNEFGIRENSQSDLSSRKIQI